VPILTNVKNQGADTNSYTTLNKKILIPLFICYSLQDEADHNEGTNQKLKKIGTVLLYYQLASLFLIKELRLHKKAITNQSSAIQ
jgi:hypothetical protein